MQTTCRASRPNSLCDMSELLSHLKTCERGSDPLRTFAARPETNSIVVSRPAVTDNNGGSKTEKLHVSCAIKRGTNSILLVTSPKLRKSYDYLTDRISIYPSQTCTNTADAPCGVPGKCLQPNNMVKIQKSTQCRRIANSLKSCVTKGRLL